MRTITMGNVMDWIAVTFDPEGLSPAQRAGEVCVVCHKRWPRPRVRVGRLPDSAPVLACRECAEVIRPGVPARRPVLT